MATEREVARARQTLAGDERALVGALDAMDQLRAALAAASDDLARRQAATQHASCAFSTLRAIAGALGLTYSLIMHGRGTLGDHEARSCWTPWTSCAARSRPPPTTSRAARPPPGTPRAASAVFPRS